MFAVKMIRLVHSYHGIDQNKVKAIKKEIDRYKLIQHKNIVKYHGGEMIPDNVFCIYLEFLPSGSVADTYKQAGPLNEHLCRSYITQVLEATEYLHSLGVIHGDIKGSNILLCKDNNTVKLCDLGNSRILENNKSFSSVKTVLNGSLAWMAPEAIHSQVGKRSDVWSIGCLLVEMLTGGSPWGTRY
jgi:serine/threonine protein kinase